MASGEAVRRFRHRSEFSRTRDVFRHLNPWADSYTPGALYRDAFATDDTQSPAALQPCPDTTLAAIAQLCALRMKARTCLVTLVCKDKEYVLADMSKQASFQQSIGNIPDSEAWIGTSCFSYDQGMTAQAVEDWCKARRIREQPKDSFHHYTEGLSPHWFIVSDVRQNSRLQNLAFVQHGQWIRFYCSLPLRSAQGSVIGSLTVLDEAPRYGVSAQEMALMEDLSDTIVQHLDATAVRAQRQRSERFIQSMSLFNVGENSMRDWWQSQDDSRVLNMGRNVAKGTAEERQRRLDAQFGLEDELDQAEAQSRASTATTGSPNPDSRKSASPGSRRRRPQRTSAKDTFDLATSSSLTYSRASNLLREALGADGVVIVNANATTASIKRDDSGGESDPAPAISGSPNDPNLRKHSSIDDMQSAFDAAQICEVLSFSTRTRSSTRGHRASREIFNLSVPYLQRLIRRYPQGSVFHFDQENKAFVPSSDDSSHSGTQSSADDIKTEKRRRSKDEEVLGEVVKAANTISFYPLYDDTNERWRSCIFAWKMPEDTFFSQAEDLPYLRTFGHSLIAELSRLESVAADYAKGTFISSISHELRSPLHGILAATEFLEETELNAFQLEMTHAIGTAGKTLLDTVNHILDHSKISRFMRSSKTGTASDGTVKYGSLAGALKRADSAPTVDLALLTEEVVETCVTSHRSHSRPAGIRSNSISGASDTRSWRGQMPHTSTDVTSDVCVTLNIAKRKDWTVDMQPGAWTRILTNLVGNALKYTRKGNISIHLEVLDDNLQTAGHKNRIPVQLVVEDTGVGMSQQFLAQDLFTPFKQEDPHSSGTGLGLSIVKQIAQDIGAVLDFSSTQGHGTRITLSFTATLQEDAGTPGDSPTRDALTRWPENLLVDSFRLLPSPDVHETGEAAFDLVGSSVTVNAREWLGCVVSHEPVEPSTNSTGTSVCAITESDLAAWSATDPAGLASLLQGAASHHSHILVLAGSMRSVSLDESLKRNLPLESVFVHQPVGPRKLLRAITSDRDSFTSVQSPRPFETPDPASDREPSPALHVPSAAKNTTSGPPPTADITEQLRLATLSAKPGEDLQLLPSPTPTSPYPSIASRRFSTTPVSDSLDEVTAPSSMSSETRDSSGNADTVLLVEDNEVNMKILVALMNRLERPYRCCENGREAVNTYRQRPGVFFVVLMDMSMPVMNGFDATAKIRETEQKHKLPRVYICALTGVTSEEARARAFACGVDQFFSKPVKIKELRALLEKVERERETSGSVTTASGSKS